MKIWVGIIGLCMVGMICFADDRIITYLRHAPPAILSEVEQTLLNEYIQQKINNFGSLPPDKVADKVYKASVQDGIRPTLGGFLALYMGYFDISNYDGLIHFPLRHLSPKIHLVVTPAVTLVPIEGNMMSHIAFDQTTSGTAYTIPDDEQARMYLYERKVDEKSKIIYWEITKEAIPSDKRISLMSLILLTKPKNIVVPLGKYVADPSEQMILPGPYVISAKDRDIALLNSMDMLRFFEPVEVESKEAGQAVQSQLTNI